MEKPLEEVNSEDQCQLTEWLRLVKEKVVSQYAAQTAFYGFDFENDAPLPSKRFNWVLTDLTSTTNSTLYQMDSLL